MSQPKAQLPHHSFTRQFLAVALAWLAITAGLPTNAISSPLPAVMRVRFAGSLGAALPPAEPAPPDPAPAPAPVPPDGDRENRKLGEITIGQPKIWQYERVNSLLDGLLRDVQGVSMNDLVALDPNATNGAAVKFVQSMLEIGVQYSQADAAANAIALQAYRTNLQGANQQIQANNAYLQQLYQERQSLTTQLLPAIQADTALQSQLATNPPTGDALTALKNQEMAASDLVKGLQAQLTAVNTQITAATSGPQLPTAPTLTATASPATSGATDKTLGTFLGSLPQGIQTDIVNQLQSPSLPATKKLDNFITLLYERLAREISVLQDDVMRDTENVPFLVQFDVGLYPSGEAKNHVGVVEFSMNCDGCKVYSIYPGQSSYNIATYHGSSQSFGLWGAVKTLIGFGLNADYRRQTDTLKGDLVQSVYMSGFQEGAESQDRTDETRSQRFGWYYGTSPIEKTVSPGIRTTFAIVSIPRSFLKACIKSAEDRTAVQPLGCRNTAQNDDAANCRVDQKESREPDRKQQAKTNKPICSLAIETDDVGATSVKLYLTAHADWVPRDDPGASWWSSSFWGGSGEAHGITRVMKVTLPGTDSINSTPELVLKERQLLHVTGLEYNPVYIPVPKDKAPGAATTPSPGSTQASASGTGSGTASVTISSAGTATASSSGTGGSTVNATASAPPASSSSSPGGAASADAFTGCKPYQCAALLIKLAEPLDPNLQVTVRGVPLRRVRDWRGRATSILPPTQSQSDSPSPSGGAASSTSAPAQPPRSELVSSASLLEADQLGPNTWMEVDSHRLLINVSADLADQVEFPSIQIVDPARHALFLPLDLDEGFTELIVNGFHFAAVDEAQFTSYLDNRIVVAKLKEQLRPKSTGPNPDPDKKHAKTFYRPAGPYSATTFLPLFLPDRRPQRIYAYLGESGIQLLVGFLHDSSDSGTEPEWQAAHTQVVIEDRDLDLAWSLSCNPQGAEMACDLPIREMQSAYKLVNEKCSIGGAHYQLCPSIDMGRADYPGVSTLEVWVEQFDPEGKQAFYSPSPARIGLLPLASTSPRSDSQTDANTDSESQAAPKPSDDAPALNFSPWHFEEAQPDTIKVTGCNYPKLNLAKGEILILGTHIPTAARAPGITAPTEGCLSFNIPTIALTHPEVVLEYKSSRVPESLPTAIFRPSYRKPVVVPDFKPGNSLAIDHWTIDIPMSRLDCHDRLDILEPGSPIKAHWRVGPVALDVQSISGSSNDTCAAQIKNKAPQSLAQPPDWAMASKDGQIVLELTLYNKDLLALPIDRKIHILRGPLLSEIATLPDLQTLLFPTKLKITAIGTSQFSLEGDNAGRIDAVTLQGPEISGPITTAAAGRIAVVTLPESSDTKAAPKTPPPATPPKTVTVVPTTAGGGDKLQIQAASPSNFAPTAGAVSVGGKSAKVDPNCWTDKMITVNVPKGFKAGKLQLIVTTTVSGKKITSTGSFMATGKDAASNADKGCPAATSTTSAALKAGTYVVVPLIAVQNDGDANVKYRPLEVTDDQGKPLTFAVTAKASGNDNGISSPASDGPTTTVTIIKKTSTTPGTTTATPPATKQ